MWLEFFVSAIVTLLVVVDPVGLAPTFLGVTHDMPHASRMTVALRASLIAAALLGGTALVGDWLLRTLSITLPAFRIAGGLLLFSIASEMVFGLRSGRQARQAEDALEERVRNVAAFPLGIPLMAGPGAITATVLLAGRADMIRCGSASCSASSCWSPRVAISASPSPRASNGCSAAPATSCCNASSE